MMVLLMQGNFVFHAGGVLRYPICDAREPVPYDYKAGVLLARRRIEVTDRRNTSSPRSCVEQVWRIISPLFSQETRERAIINHVTANRCSMLQPLNEDVSTLYLPLSFLSVPLFKAKERVE